MCLVLFLLSRYYSHSNAFYHWCTNVQIYTYHTQLSKPSDLISHYCVLCLVCTCRLVYLVMRNMYKLTCVFCPKLLGINVNDVSRFTASCVQLFYFGYPQPLDSISIHCSYRLHYSYVEQILKWWKTAPYDSTCVIFPLDLCLHVLLAIRNRSG
jgi:hypothetical protein